MSWFISKAKTTELCSIHELSASVVTRTCLNPTQLIHLRHQAVATPPCSLALCAQKLCAQPLLKALPTGQRGSSVGKGACRSSLAM